MLCRAGTICDDAHIGDKLRAAIRNAVSVVLHPRPGASLRRRSRLPTARKEPERELIASNSRRS